MTLMRFDPFRPLDRLAEHTMSVGARAETRDGVPTLTIPVTEASKPRRVVLGSADRPADAPNVVAGPAPAQDAAATESTPFDQGES